MDPRTLGIVLIVLAFLCPLWAVAMQGDSRHEAVALDQQSEIRPLDSSIDSPTTLSPSQVGVVVWVALLVLVGTVSAVHRAMHRLGVPNRDEAAIWSDGGRVDTAGTADTVLYERVRWLETSDRWIVSLDPPSETSAGTIAVLACAMASVAFGTLFTIEYVGAARTQYFGGYACGLFLSLAALTAAYYVWFVPSIEVAERRAH
jgi:hypothetical protein